MTDVETSDPQGESLTPQTLEQQEKIVEELETQRADQTGD